MKNPLSRPGVNGPFTKLVRPLARLLPTEVLWHLPVVGVVEVAPPGWAGPPVRMVNPGTDRVASMLFWRGVEGWEPTTIRLFLQLVSPGCTVIDVGANSGLFSLLAGRREPSARVHALEPVARVFSLLEDNVVANGLANVTCHRLACADTQGTVTIQVPDGESVPMMASLLPAWSAGPHSGEEVACVTVDSLVKEHALDRVQVLKVDAEGSEDAVLRGAARTLAEHRPFVFCEVLDRRELASAVMAAVVGQDYRFFALTPDGVQACRELRGRSDHDESHNYLLVPAERLSEAAPVLES